jgi:hypothetical protein
MIKKRAFTGIFAAIVAIFFITPLYPAKAAGAAVAVHNNSSGCVSTWYISYGGCQ